MSQFNRNIITNDGLALASTLSEGGMITFTKIVLGNGVFAGDVTTITDMVSPKIELEIKGKLTKGNEVILTSILLPQDINEGFDWSEIGVYAKCEGDEVLFMYSSADNTSYIDPNTLDEKTINTSVVLSNVENVYITLEGGVMYLTQGDLEAHNTNPNAHSDIRALIENIDLSSVNEHVTNEHVITRTRINNQVEDIKNHITAKTSSVASSLETQTSNINAYINQIEAVTHKYLEECTVAIIDQITNSIDNVLNNLKKVGDLSGKELQFEDFVLEMTSTNYTLAKSVTNAKGGIVKIFNGNGYSYFLYKIIVDNKVILEDGEKGFLFGNQEVGAFVEIPFNTSFELYIAPKYSSDAGYVERLRFHTYLTK